MKSYVLAITITMFLSALFAFQNIGDVTVKFLTFERTFPQGVWEVFVFCAGAAIMWVFSIFSIFEVKGKHKENLKKSEEKIAALEKENKKLLDTIAAAGATKAEPVVASAPAADEVKAEAPVEG